jgi:hypothetical protein
MFVHDVQFPGISIFTLLSFIEFLLDSNLAIPMVNISIEVFNSQQLSLALASLNKAWRPAVSSKPVFSPAQFSALISHCTCLPLHVFYTNAFLLGFMALLRISNEAPPSRATYDLSRHLTRGDVSIVNGMLVIHLRWSKTLQRHRQSARLKLFPIPGSHLCPIRAVYSAGTRSNRLTRFYRTEFQGSCSLSPN